MDLTRKYRPKKLTSIIGQPKAIAVVQKWFEKKEIPHACLLTGPSGVGKTTLARIIASELKAGHNCHELNMSDLNGVDDIRKLEDSCSMPPLGGGSSVYILDELHRLSGAAQDTFLKVLEEPRDFVYFILATTSPDSLRKTIRTRCVQVALQSIGENCLERIILRACKYQHRTISEEVLLAIIRRSEGSARLALKHLETVLLFEENEEQMEALVSKDAEANALALCRLLFRKDSTWSEVATLLKAIEEEPEAIRRSVLGYARSILLGEAKNGERARRVIECFWENYWNTGNAGLALSCWEAMHD